MARKPDTPCAGCGKLLYGGSTSKPAGERMCRGCRSGVPQTTLADTAAAGDKVRTLEAMRDKLAGELESAEGRDVAPISKALLDVLRELHAGKPPAEQPEKAVSGVISLAAEAAKRRTGTAG